MRCELQVFETDLGWMAAIADTTLRGEPRLAHLVIANDSAESALQVIHAKIDDQRSTETLEVADSLRANSAWWSMLRRRLQEYSAGDEVHFDDIAVHLGNVTAFQSRVLGFCRRIRRGSTMSYAQLASAAGRPGAARAVGNVMAKNRCPLVIPCHRVLHAGGGLGGFSAPQGVTLKRRLLEMERPAELAGFST